MTFIFILIGCTLVVFAAAVFADQEDRRRIDASRVLHNLRRYFY